jgi:replication-associated recombination protein RarA
MSIYQPLSDRLRPKVLEGFVGQTHLLGPKTCAVENVRDRQFALYDILGPARSR